MKGSVLARPSRDIPYMRPVITYPVVCLEIVDLFPEDERPEILAQELDDIERVVEARPVCRESATHTACEQACPSLRVTDALMSTRTVPPGPARLGTPASRAGRRRRRAPRRPLVSARRVRSPPLFLKSTPRRPPCQLHSSRPSAVPLAGVVLVAAVVRTRSRDQLPVVFATVRPARSRSGTLVAPARSTAGPGRMRTETSPWDPTRCREEAPCRKTWRRQRLWPANSRGRAADRATNLATDPIFVCGPLICRLGGYSSSG